MPSPSVFCLSAVLGSTSSMTANFFAGLLVFRHLTELDQRACGGAWQGSVMFLSPLSRRCHGAHVVLDREIPVICERQDARTDGVAETHVNIFRKVVHMPYFSSKDSGTYCRVELPYVVFAWTCRSSKGVHILILIDLRRRRDGQVVILSASRHDRREASRSRRRWHTHV